MNDGKWTWKKLTEPVAEKFSPENLNYCQIFVNYIYTVDRNKLKFFDESGIKLPDVGQPNYGHSLTGTAAIEISRNMNFPNITLNLLCGLDGIIFANTIGGTSNSMTFLKFLKSLVMFFSQTASHHIITVITLLWTTHQFAVIELEKCLGNGWMILVALLYNYLTTYSPEFNPAELVFNKLKTILKRFEFRELFRDNLHVAVYEALKTIAQEDMSGFFRFTGYINL